MKAKEELIISAKSLPLPIVVEGENGETKKYLLKAAGRKFGACLIVPDEPNH